MMVIPPKIRCSPVMSRECAAAVVVVVYKFCHNRQTRMGALYVW